MAQRAMLAVRDAREDPRLPQELVESYGLRAYLGAPLLVGSEIVGTLCVLDTRPRDFSHADKTRLRALADEVQRRLEALAAEATAKLPVEDQPSFEAMGHQLALARIAAAELAPQLRLARQLIAERLPTSAGVLEDAPEALDDLKEALGKIDAMLRSFRRSAY